MQVAVIVQARMASTRLPGKVLLDLAGKTVLRHVLERCKMIQGAAAVCCTISESSDSNRIEDEAIRSGSIVFRGSESDVLSRYQEAAKSIGCKTIMRVTSDCPLIDPQVCDRVIKLFKTSDCRFATNNSPRSWPLGLDCEVFSFETLSLANSKTRDVHDREHVTPWMRKNLPAASIKNLSSAKSDLAQHRWTLDTKADYKFLKKVFKLLRDNSSQTDYKSVLEIIKSHRLRHPDMTDSHRETV